MNKFPIYLLALGAAVPALCGETQFWQQASLADFAKGNLKGLSLSSDGRLRLAPSLAEYFDAATPYLWAIARDSKGNLYAGGGTQGRGVAKLFVIDGKGQGKTLAELEGLAIQAIVVDARDRVYAATSPEGKVYRISADGKAEVFYDPRAKYIWALAFSRSGELFVATGDRGEIHRVGADGKGQIFFETEEAHVRSLAVDAGGNLIAGTDPGGLILRITAQGLGFVLYQASRREITAVAVAANGQIFAAGVGNRLAPAAPALPPGPVPTVTIQPQAVIPGAAPRPAGASASPPPPPSLPTTIAGGSEIYRIDTDGDARRVWSDPSEIVYAITFDDQGKPIFGTGNEGRIYRIDSDNDYTRLRSVPPTQVTGFATGPGGKLFVATGNIGKVYSLGPESEKQGTLESDVLDAQGFAYWGRLTWRGASNGGKVNIDSRSGNLNVPQRNWSPWAAVPLSENSGRLSSPAARFAQFRAALEAAPGGHSPEVRLVEIAYLPKNVAPRVEEIDIPQANYRFPLPSAASLTAAGTLNLPPLGRRSASRSAATGGPAAPTVTSPAMTAAKGWQGVRWLATDANGDSLVARLDIQGTAESTWKPLKTEVREHYVSWDTTTMPDGEYRLRITVSDSPDNTPDQALSGSLESEIFWIDNTPPEIVGLSGTAAANGIEVRWKAADSRSVVLKAEYSINGGDWLVVEPVGKLSDWKELEYRITVPRSGETTIAVRVTDEYDNQAVRKVVVK
ncbi:MAG: hypothetical protein K2X35_22855 [Bryobacteraceae bacterium]|nr:hypothetical protein [Bryobacteraceae bacterium]